MSFPKETFALKRPVILILFFAFFTVFISNNICAQSPTEEADLPIDPNALKNASPSELQDFLKDNNNLQKKAGEDVHKNLADLKNKNVIAKDSTQKDDFKKKLYNPDEVYGSDLFKSNQIMELSELSTPPLDYPIGGGDHIVVSLWGGADFEENYEVARDGSIFPQGLGKITIQGLTFDNARKIIYDRFKKVIPPSTNVSVTLGQPRSIVIQTS